MKWKKDNKLTGSGSPTRPTADEEEEEEGKEEEEEEEEEEE